MHTKKNRQREIEIYAERVLKIQHENKNKKIQRRKSFREAKDRKKELTKTKSYLKGKGNIVKQTKKRNQDTVKYHLRLTSL